MTKREAIEKIQQLEVKSDQVLLVKCRKGISKQEESRVWEVLDRACQHMPFHIRVITDSTDLVESITVARAADVDPKSN